MTKAQYADIFLKSHPGFFESEAIRNIADDIIYEEMFLPLADASVWEKEIPLPDGVTFGYYEGEKEVLLKAVEEVDAGWPPFFGKNDPVYCGYVNGELASFCLLEDMGSYEIGGKTVKIAGPGCVGTLPKFRRLGIGRTMIRQATDILKEKGYDYSYIHYTGVAPWYEKLGYKTEIRWDHNGIIE